MPGEQLPDIFSLLEPIVAGKPFANPWVRIDGTLRYKADYGTLEELLAVPVREGSGSQSGRLAKTIDVDVLIARWSRGPELLVSTKSMASSFRKNLSNRFEEAYGDAKNLRGRYPLAAMGFVFLLRSTALAEPGTFDRIVDMLRKLQAEGDVYDATCLLVAGWANRDPQSVQVMNEIVPPDLTADRFLATLVGAVLARTPIEMHVEARSRREHRELQVEEEGATSPPED